MNVFQCVVLSCQLLVLWGTRVTRVDGRMEGSGGGMEAGRKEGWKEVRSSIFKPILRSSSIFEVIFHFLGHLPFLRLFSIFEIIFHFWDHLLPFLRSSSIFEVIKMSITNFWLLRAALWKAAHLRGVILWKILRGILTWGWQIVRS